MKKKNGFLTFIFSFIPGAGQMYQGAMKRGLSIMLLYGACIVLSALIFSFSMVFAIPLMIIMAYSFFDTWHIRNLNDEERKQYIDKYIWDEEDFVKLTHGKSIKRSKFLKAIGVILIILGIVVFIDSFVLRLLDNLEIEFARDIIRTISRYAPSVIASAIAIIVGVKLISNKTKED